MGLVETVAGERLDLVEQPLGSARGHTGVLLTAVHPLVAELGHLDLVLLAHCLAQVVRFRAREAGQRHRKAHRRLLVDQHAAGVLELGLHLGVLEVRASVTLLDGDEVIHEARIHRTRAVERSRGGDVLEVEPAADGKILEQLLHAAGLELEHAGCGALTEGVHHVRLLERQAQQIDVDPVPGPHQLARDVQDIERGETEDVHLDQPEVLDDALVPAHRGHFATSLNDRAFGQRCASHDHARSMGCERTHGAF